MSKYHWCLYVGVSLVILPILAQLAARMLSVTHRSFSGYPDTYPFRPLAGSETSTPLTDGLTAVTAFFNVGKFQKGNNGPDFTPNMYRDWAKVFARLDSPTIIFVDTEEDLQYFSELRSLQLPPNMTVVHLLDRRQMWAFQLEPSIAKIFSRPGYPVHTPNTVVPGYSAAMHAKYELMQMTLRSNPFSTRYFCWLDVGLFKHISGSSVSGPRFALSLPPNFDVDAVAYNEVFRRNPNLSLQEIVSRNDVWVCGCFFVGRVDVLQQWAEEYQNATEKMIEDGWMSTDQQVIYAMANGMNPRTRLQLYRPDGRYHKWYNLAYLSMEAGTSDMRPWPPHMFTKEFYF